MADDEADGTRLPLGGAPLHLRLYVAAAVTVLAMPSKVLVMVDENGRFRGKTHALDCSHAQTWAAQGHGDGYGPRPYQLVAAYVVPEHVGRCSFCGGGR
jgi:hypothetical protein